MYKGIKINVDNNRCCLKKMAAKLFHFNPTCEMAVANGQASYMPPNHLKTFEDDLAALPCFLGDSKDYLLVPEKVNSEWINHLSIIGFEPPNFITSENDIPASEKIDLFSPWGWSLAEHKKLQPFMKLCSEKWLQHPMAQWKSDHAILLSRETTFNFISILNQIDSNAYNLLEIPSIPLKIKSLNEVKNLHNLTSPPVLLKTPWSASGRGLFKIRDINEHAEQNAWVKSKLKKQGGFYAEPYLDKILDVSFHFLIESETVKYIGNTFFKTNSKGQFTGCYIRYPENSNFDEGFLSDACKQAADILFNGLKQLNINKIYQGALGIDAIFFKNRDNIVKLNPCVEINLRHTMGLLNLFLRKRTHPQKNGKWVILKDISVSDKMQNGKKLLQDGFIFKGTVLLTPPSKHVKYFAQMTVE